MFAKQTIGTFERKIHGWFIYRIDKGYHFLKAQDMAGRRELYNTSTPTWYFLPKHINIWQPQLAIWLMAKGYITS